MSCSPVVSQCQNFIWDLWLLADGYSCSRIRGQPWHPVTVGQRPPWPLASWISIRSLTNTTCVLRNQLKEGTCSKENQSWAPPLCTWQLIIVAMLIYKKQQSSMYAQDKEQTVPGAKVSAVLL